jgi:hypothetical protein
MQHITNNIAPIPIHNRIAGLQLLDEAPSCFCPAVIFPFGCNVLGFLGTIVGYFAQPVNWNNINAIAIFLVIYHLALSFILTFLTLILYNFFYYMLKSLSTLSIFVLEPQNYLLHSRQPFSF